MRRLKVLLSAYCCEPDRGSEPGVGWNIALGLAQHHDVWVLTRSTNRETIEGALPSAVSARPHFIYYDLPRWARWWKRGMRGLQLYYYLWQIGVAHRARALHRRIEFDVAHHLTLGKYWVPSFLWRLPVPFIWGPVGGGESAPISYCRSYSLRGMLYEWSRSTAKWLAMFDPFVRLTAKRSHIALVVTADTERCIVRLGCRSVRRVSGQTAVSSAELEMLDVAALDAQSAFRILTIGRLLHWKGVHLGLAAFAQANLAGAEYWIVGGGPEEKRLRELAAALDIADKVIFLGQLSRKRALTVLRTCDVFMHPSLHDFSPTVVFEAMAAGKPVICMDLGGPAAQVTSDTGILVPAAHPTQAVTGLAQGLRLLAADKELRQRLGNTARTRVKAHFTWERKVQTLLEIYSAATAESPIGDGNAPRPALSVPLGTDG